MAPTTDFVVELPSNLENCPDENSQERAQRYADFFNQTQKQVAGCLKAEPISDADPRGETTWKAHIFYSEPQLT